VMASLSVSIDDINYPPASFICQEADLPIGEVRTVKCILPIECVGAIYDI
jgi:hypothetical protein